MEVIKSLKSDDKPGVKVSTTKVPTVKMKNIAKAYGWWIAKDCVGLSVLKVSQKFKSEP